LPETTYELELKTDSRGFIGNGSNNVIEIEKPTKTYRIFLLGGSTVAGWRATSSKTTIAAYLERFLNSPNYPKRNIQVINTGVVGYFSPQQLVRAQLELVHYRPDMIITLDGYNDFVWSSTTFNRPVGYRVKDWVPNSHGYQDSLRTGFASMQSFSGSFRQFMWVTRNIFSDPFSRLYTVQLLKYAFSKLTRFFHSEVRRKRPTPGRFIARFNPKGIESYKENLISLIGSMHARDVKVVVLLQPNLSFTNKQLTLKERLFLETIGVEFDGWLPAVKRYHDSARDMFFKIKENFHDGRSVWVEDLSSLFDSNSNTVYADQYGHYNDYGNGLIAKRLKDILDSMLMLQGEPG